MSAQAIFLFPGQIITGFILSLFGLPGHVSDSGWHLILTVFFSLAVWIKIVRAAVMIIQRITGFEPGR